MSASTGGRRRIGSNEELQRLFRVGSGYIYNSFYRALHKAGCDHVERMTVGTTKIFYPDLEATRADLGSGFNPCPDCLPLSTVATPAASGERRAAPQAEVEHWAEFEGPETIRGVYAWLDTWLPFDKLDVDQKRIRAELRSRIRKLDPKPGEILLATYAGPRHPASDVENLLLYNIDMDGACFQRCANSGVRFELAPKALREPPSRQELPCSYTFRLVPSEPGFEHWQVVRELARFSAVTVNAAIEDLPTRIWWALHHADVEVTDAPKAHEAPFGISLRVACPSGYDARPSIVKKLIDGVVAAFQAHGDRTGLKVPAARVAKLLGVADEEVSRRLLSRERAVLGVAKTLLRPRLDSFQWNPADHLCLAGEVLDSGPSDEWVLSGQICEISRA
jgi:hypothetical protein